MPDWTLSPDPESLRRIRHLIRQQLAGTDTADVELVATELVTNVIRHANTELVFSLQADGDTVRIEVQDGSSILPAVRDLESGAATGGTGLRIVEALSEQWGAAQREDGKVVWAEFRTPGSSPGR